jgi:hypothetical protein
MLRSSNPSLSLGDSRFTSLWHAQLSPLFCFEYPRPRPYLARRMLGIKLNNGYESTNKIAYASLYGSR